MVSFSGTLNISYIPQEKLSLLTGVSDFKPTNIQLVQWDITTNIPMLYGSSIKGVLRRNAERIADLLGLKACRKKDPTHISEEHHTMGGLCDVCKIFGCPNSPSKIQVTDALSALPSITPSVFTGIEIDRKSGTVLPNALFQFQALPKGQSFEGHIHFKNLTESEFKLLICALKDLQWTGIGRHAALLSINLMNQDKLPLELQKIVKEVFEYE
ncbi:MAG: RAMP superfamily CRISPR-associated protein [Candidatus Helarchaeota archaeon]